MPPPGQMSIAVWNVQNFGGANQNDYRGANNQLLAFAIRDFVRDANIDVLAIMEVLPPALPCLQTLLNTLNAGLIGAAADWRFDWIKGSVDFGAPYPPTAPADMSWRGGPGSPRVEGYALFWRTNRGTFRVVPALRNCSEGGWPQPFGVAVRHDLELVTDGLDFDYQDEQHWQVDSGYNPATSLLSPFSTAMALVPWATLNFPWVSIGRFAQPRQFQSRRPAFAVLELNNGGAVANRLCPLIFYHAPSQRTRAELGTFLGGLSRQINVTQSLLVNGNQDPAVRTRNQSSIIGGDFNWNRPNPPDFVYSKYVDPYANNVLAGGSNLQFTTAPGDATTVQINQPQNGFFGGPPIVGVNNGDYYWTRIDQLMFRNLNSVAVSTGTYNVLGHLRAAPSPFANSLTQFRAHFAALNLASPWLPNAVTGPLDVAGNPIYGNRFNNWNAFWADLNIGPLAGGPHFTTARSAAEFFHIFVSDHLPLVLTFNWL